MIIKINNYRLIHSLLLIGYSVCTVSIAAAAEPMGSQGVWSESDSNIFL
jgi:hypothetical protein